MNLAIIGCTGAVGTEFIKLLIERRFKYKSIYLYASERSIDKTYEINGVVHSVKKLEYNSKIFNNIDIAFFFISSALSTQYAPLANYHGCIVIDNSSAYRMILPLIIPEINYNIISHYQPKIIANPNCSTILLCMVLFPLHKLYKITNIVISTYQALSGAGQQGMEELETQIQKYSQKQDIVPNYFKSQCLNNVFSHDSKIDLLTGNNEEENKIINETRKILNDQNIIINATCIRVPVLRAHCESVNITFETEVTKQDIYSALNNFPGIKIIDDQTNNKFPESLLATNKNEVLVGRIRLNQNKNISLFLAGDQLRKGAALNAIQIAEKIINK